jgi:hypothetical protein
MRRRLIEGTVTCSTMLFAAGAWGWSGTPTSSFLQAGQPSLERVALVRVNSGLRVVAVDGATDVKRPRDPGDLHTLRLSPGPHTILAKLVVVFDGGVSRLTQTSGEFTLLLVVEAGRRYFLTWNVLGDFVHPHVVDDSPSNGAAAIGASGEPPAVPLKSLFTIAGARLEASGGDFQQLSAMRTLLSRAGKGLDLTRQADRDTFLGRYKSERQAHPELDAVIVGCKDIKGL